MKRIPLLTVFLSLLLGTVSQAYEMAELDFDRALEMARLIPEGEMGYVFSRYSAEHGLARMLLSGPEKWNPSLGYSWNRVQTTN